MLGLKSTLITAVLGLVVALSFAYLWKAEQVKSARLSGELSQAMVNTETLKQAVSDQRNAFTKMANLVDKNQEWIDELSKQKDVARSETELMRAQIDALRATEAVEALAAPFKRGNDARDRLSISMRRIAGKTGGAGQGSDNTGVASAGAAMAKKKLFLGIRLANPFKTLMSRVWVRS